jgi:hypothetical protein
MAGMLNGYLVGGLKQMGFQAARRVLVPCRFMASESLAVAPRQCTHCIQVGLPVSRLKTKQD